MFLLKVIVQCSIRFAKQQTRDCCGMSTVSGPFADQIFRLCVIAMAERGQRPATLERAQRAAETFG